MNFILKFSAFIFILSVVQSTETQKDVKSFKVNEKMVYDCVDIYKQPSLSHPLLKNHKIQKVECPDGTVPILRNTKEDMANVQSAAEKHFGVLTPDTPDLHIAGVRPQQGQGLYRGVASLFTVHDLNNTEYQTSYTYIYVGSKVDYNDNYIQTGWMVSPSLYGDGRTWSYGYFKGANGTRCYNTLCPGFIQVSKSDPLSGPLPYPSKGERAIDVTIQQDSKTGHWWTTDVVDNGPDVPIGYWPKELFDLINNGVDMVGVTGAVQTYPGGRSPPMGNGQLPTDDERQAAQVEDLQIIDNNFKVKESNKYRLEKVIDSTNCYGIKDGKSVLFTYGGPGGDSCGT